MIVRIRSAVIALALYIPFLLLGGGYYAFAMWVIGIVGLFEFAEMQKLNIINHIGFFFCCWFNFFTYTSNVYARIYESGQSRVFILHL